MTDDCRVKCDACHGHGSADYYEMLDCDACTQPAHSFPCPAHACRQCSGSGMVCPTCRGMRFVRGAVFRSSAGAHQDVRDVTRCTVCCEGNNVNIKAERAAIDRYLFKYRDWQHMAALRDEPFAEPSLARQVAADAEIVTRQRSFEAGQRERQRTRQRRHIARSKAVEAQIDAEIPPAPVPSEHDWEALRGVVRQFNRPAKRRAGDAS